MTVPTKAMSTVYGFDIDGTLTVPTIAKLANDLHDAGHTIIIITGGLRAHDSASDDMEERRNHRKEQLTDLGVKYHDLYVCVGYDTTQVAALKGRVCKDNKVSILFEDTPLFTEAVRRYSPETVTFLTE